jgi:phage tail sheath protein FI
MPEFVAPGIYVEEVPSGVKPIAGVGTSTAGFAGLAERGPRVPQLVTSWLEFENRYGQSISDRSYLGYAVKGFFDNGGSRCYVALAAGTGAGDIIQSLDALAEVDEVSLLLAPDQAHPRYGERERQAISETMLRQCEDLQDRFALLSASQGQEDFARVRPPIDSSYGALYYPWIAADEPASGATHSVPSIGHVAGVYARTDMERGVHKAPANVALRGVADLEFSVTRKMLETLTQRGVNGLLDSRQDGRGIQVWGARTMSSDPEWKYVPIRRLALFIKESIVEGTKWVAFERNNQTLWDAVRRAISAFLFDLWRGGALTGATPQEAFFVRCDRSVMTQNDIGSGRLVCLVGFAPLRPAEFTILSTNQATADAAP